MSDDETDEEVIVAAMSGGRRRQQNRRVVHTNSRNVDELRRDLEALESQCRRANVPISAPEEASEIDTTPMLGHTKGNTKSNRKKIKHAQQVLLLRARVHLERLLQKRGINPCTYCNDNDNDNDNSDNEEGNKVLFDSSSDDDDRPNDTADDDE